MTHHDDPPELQQAVRRAVALTHYLAPPPGYDPSYWREERIAIANLAVWRAYLDYQPDRGASLEGFAVRCAVRAIVREWERLCRQGRGVVAMPVDEETGEEMEFEDVGACEAIEENAQCGEIRAALEKLPEEQRVILELHYGLGLSEREIARQLGRCKSWVHRQLVAALEALRAMVGEKGEEGGKRG